MTTTIIFLSFFSYRVLNFILLTSTTTELHGGSVTNFQPSFESYNACKWIKSSRIIKRYNDTCSIKIRHGGIPRKTRLARNLRRSASQMAKEMHVSLESIWKTLKIDLHVNPYNNQKLHELNNQQEVRLKRTEVLKRLDAAGELANFIFFDEIISR